MARVCGKVPKETPMLGNGSLVRRMVMGFILGLMVIVTKVNLKIASNMVKGWKNSPMVTFIKAFTSKENHPDLANITGQMVAISRAHLRWVYVVVMEYGRKVQEIVTSIRVNIWTTRNQDMVFSHGQVGMYTRVIIRTIHEMVMVRCTGRMVVFIRVIGGMGFSMGRGRFMCRERV